MDTTIRTTFIILFCWWNIATAQQPQELFLQANKAYEQGDFAGALRSYQSIKKKGPILWYNIGNCYYHQHDLARAIASWQRALKNASASLAHDVEHNCAVAYQKLAKEYHPGRWDNSFLKYHLPLLMIQFLFLFCWLFLCILIWRWRKSWHIYVIMILLCITVLYTGIMLWYCYERQTTIYGIVIDKTAPVYIGPHTQYHVIENATAGDPVQLIERRSSWYKVTKGGVVGWMPSSAIEIIEQLC